MNSFKATFLKIKGACESFGKQYLIFTEVIAYVNMAFFGVIFLAFLNLLVRVSRSADVKQVPNFLFEIYIGGFVIISGIKLICQPMLTFVLRSQFEGRTLIDLLKIARVWRNVTIGVTILQLVYATVIPSMPFSDEIVSLIWAFMECYLISYTYKKMVRQQEEVLAMEVVAPWA